MVQRRCHKTWSILLLALKSVDPFSSLQCNDTSRLLFPVPHCCSDAGLDLPYTSTSTVAYSPEKSSLPTESDGTVVGVVTSVVVLLILAAVIAVVIVPLLIVVFSKRRRRKQMESMQLDILAM